VALERRSLKSEWQRAGNLAALWFCLVLLCLHCIALHCIALRLTFINLVVHLPRVLLIYVASHRHARTQNLLACACSNKEAG
jgi:hypothetical protein